MVTTFETRRSHLKKLSIFAFKKILWIVVLQNHLKI